MVTFHGGGHSDALRNRARRAQRATLRPLLARAAALVAVARFEIDQYSSELRIPRARFVLIPNGVDLPAPVGGAAVDGRRHGRAADRLGGSPRALQGPPARDRRTAGGARPAPWALACGSPAQAPTRTQLRAIAAKLGVADAVEISSVAAEDRSGRFAHASSCAAWSSLMASAMTCSSVISPLR